MKTKTITLANSYLGFTDAMSPMQKAKAEKILDESIRSNGSVMTQKEWVYSKLQGGAAPNKEENYSYYSSRTNAMTKPKTLYMIQWNHVNHNGNVDTVSNEINKTLYDYACHIINNNLHNSNELNEFLAVEQQKVDEKAKAEEVQKAAEQAQAEKEKQEKDQFQQWLQSAVEQYNDKEKVKLYLSIFNDAYPDRPATELQAKTFCVYVDYIYKPQCRQALKDRLHVGNPTSKKIFFHITGVKLPKTDKETMPMLDYLTGSHYYGIVPYKQRKEYAKGNENKERFYRFVNGIGFVEAYGDKVEYKGITGYVFKSKETGTVVIEALTGSTIARKNENEDLKLTFQNAIESRGVEQTKGKIEEFIQRYGMSPLYKQQEIVTV